MQGLQMTWTFSHTSAKDVDTIEQYFTFIAVKVIDVEVEKC